MAKQCKYEKSLRILIENTQQFLHWMDVEMTKGPDATRGKRIASVCNALEMSVDRVRYFTLGVDCRSDKKPRAGAKARTKQGPATPSASAAP